MEKQPPTIAFVVPCFNEEQTIPALAEKLGLKIKSLADATLISAQSFILFVDDGSKDNSWNLIVKLNRSNPKIKGLRLSRNWGHQNAILAGLLRVVDAANCTITLDADLQDDVSVLDRFVSEYRSGSDIVYGVRKERKSDSLLKRLSANLFYKLMQKLGVDLVYNHADYRLLSQRVLKELRALPESDLFLRGLFPFLGFKSTNVYFKRTKRLAGSSKYPLSKMFRLALDGITSFSLVPLRLIFFTGALISVGTLVFGIYFLFRRPAADLVLILLPIYFLGGIQLLALGVMGEYIGRAHLEAKRRPRFIVEEEL